MLGGLQTAISRNYVIVTFSSLLLILLLHAHQHKACKSEQAY